MNDMRAIILRSPEQIKHSLEVNKDVRVEADGATSIILAAMGGSWHPGALLQTLNMARLPLIIHRDYGLPETVGKPFDTAQGKPLVIVSSYSGNTEEALSAYEAAQKAGYPLLVNTSGGTLEERSIRDGVPMAKIDYPGMQPRHTTYASFAGVAAALINSGLAQDISAGLIRAGESLAQNIAGYEDAAKQLAGRIKGTIPVYYASHRLAYAAHNLKIQTNENAKYPAFWNEIPEANHNEMIGLSRQAELAFPLHAVFVRDASDHPSNQARMDVTMQLYEQWGLKVSAIEAQGDTMLDKLFYMIVFGLWTTYHLALAYNLDPVPVDAVENFKKKLKETAL